MTNRSLQAVEAKTGDGTPGVWTSGAVVALNYREDKWPEGRTAPYQIELSDGRLIFAPYDDDCVVRARATEVKGKEKEKGRGKGKGKGKGKKKGKKGRAGRK